MYTIQRWDLTFLLVFHGMKNANPTWTGNSLLQKNGKTLRAHFNTTPESTLHTVPLEASYSAAGPKSESERARAN